MKIVAQRSDTVYLVQISATKARVLSLDTGIFYPPAPLQSILARGYWEPYTASADTLAALIEQVTDATAPRPAEGAS